MILLDTNALIWLDQWHPRVRALARGAQRLYVSPASLLELQVLIEAGRVRVRGGLGDIVDDDRWVLDDPPSAAWFTMALALGWTRDPFDRLLVAHAQMRGWRIATGDTVLLAQLAETARIAL